MVVVSSSLVYQIPIHIFKICYGFWQNRLKIHHTWLSFEKSSKRIMVALSSSLVYQLPLLISIITQTTPAQWMPGYFSLDRRTYHWPVVISFKNTHRIFFNFFKVFCSYQISWAGDVSNVLMQEVVAIRLNIHSDLPHLKTIKHLNNFNEQMRMSRYDL